MGAAPEFRIFALFGVAVEGGDGRLELTGVDAGLACQLADRAGDRAESSGPVLAGRDRAKRIFLPYLAVDDDPAGKIRVRLIAAVDDVDGVVEGAVKASLPKRLPWRLTTIV